VSATAKKKIGGDKTRKKRISHGHGELVDVLGRGGGDQPGMWRTCQYLVAAIENKNSKSQTSMKHTNI